MADAGKVKLTNEEKLKKIKNLKNSLNDIERPFLKIILENSSTSKENCNKDDFKTNIGKYVGELEKFITSNGNIISQKSLTKFNAAKEALNGSLNENTVDFENISKNCDALKKGLHEVAKSFGGMFSSKESKELKTAFDVHERYLTYCAAAAAEYKGDEVPSYNSVSQKKDDFLATLELLYRKLEKDCTEPIGKFITNYKYKVPDEKIPKEYYELIGKLKDWTETAQKNVGIRLKRNGKEGKSRSDKSLLEFLKEELEKLCEVLKDRPESPASFSKEYWEDLNTYVTGNVAAEHGNWGKLLKHAKKINVGVFNYRAVLGDKRIKKCILKTIEAVCGNLKKLFGKEGFEHIYTNRKLVELLPPSQAQSEEISSSAKEPEITISLTCKKTKDKEKDYFYYEVNCDDKSAEDKISKWISQNIQDLRKLNPPGENAFPRMFFSWPKRFWDSDVNRKLFKTLKKDNPTWKIEYKNESGGDDFDNCNWIS